MSDPAPLQALLDRYVVAYHAGDAAGCGACFTEDGQLLSPYAPPATGRAAIVALHGDWVQEGEGKRLTLREFGLDGTLGWGLAQFDEAEADTGTSLCIFQRQPDGGWLIHMCSLNEAPPEG